MAKDIQWYQELDTKDYLVVSLQEFDNLPYTLEGRAVNIPGMPESMATCNIAKSYLLAGCVPIDEKEVPKEWLKEGFLT